MALYNEPLLGFYDRACESTPEKTAIIYLGEKFSYRKLKELIDRFATALYEIGVSQNDRVMLYIPNCPQFLIGYLGIKRIGAVQGHAECAWGYHRGS